MKAIGEPARDVQPADQDDTMAALLHGYSFVVCERPETAREAVEVRRRVYVEQNGYRIPVPDAYDRRSWFLLARSCATGQAVGSMRLTPRFAGPFECEEYFTVPRRLVSPRAIELNRFAILPEHRKGKTFLPSVTFGLFTLGIRFLRRMKTPLLTIASKPERAWTYHWIGFEETGLVAPYGKLGNSEHSLLWYDFANIENILASHPFRDFLLRQEHAEVVLPSRVPSLGLVRTDEEPARLALSA